MKRNLILCSTAVLALACFASKSAGQTADRNATASRAASASNAPSPAVKQKIAEEYGKLPLSFEANRGQTDAEVKFLSRGPGYRLFLLPDQAVLSLRGQDNAAPRETIRMSLLGAAHDSVVTGMEETPGRSNYFLGNDPAQWRANIPNYGKVRYSNVYPGVDLIYHGNRQQLEYDFLVAPGADPRVIRLRMNGAKSLLLTSEGDLLVGTADQPVRIRKPVLYQDFDGQRRPIKGSFVLTAKNTIKFRVGPYDHTKQLVIDPVLSYSVLFGGSSSEEVFGIAVDSTGAAYITGTTESPDLGTPGTLAPKQCGTPPNAFTCMQAFVAKINPAGNALVYATYVGGTDPTNTTSSGGIAVFGTNAYITGTTAANDFPTVNAFQGTRKGAENAFVSELNPTGSALVFSTYLGGSGSESFGFGRGSSIAVDGNGNAYVAGTTTSGDFPTSAGALQTTPGGGTFRSMDGSATWNASNSGLASFNIAAFAIDPKAPANVYVATSDSGVFRSTNSGQSWTAINTGLGTLNITGLAIDPVTPTTLYAASFSGVFKTTNSGTSWAAANNGLNLAGSTSPAEIMQIVLAPNTPAILYAGGSDGLFRSTDGASTWTQLSGGIPSGIQCLAIDPITNATLYAGTFEGVFKSVNGGNSWTEISNGLVMPGTTTELDIRAIAVDAKAPSTLYVTTFNTESTNSDGLGVYKTSDGGNNWSPANIGLTDLNTFGIAVDPSVAGTAYVGTFSSGVFKTTNSGATWTTANNALSNFVVGTVAVDPTASAKVYAGSLVEHVFASKFTSTGTLSYSTFLGGSAEEASGGIAVDSQGNAYVAGTTVSRNFPVLGAFQSTRQGRFDAFVSKLNSAGSALSFSTYLGGTGGASDAFAIAVDSLSSAYVTGQTTATNFPLANAFQSINHGSNAFVTKFAPSGASLSYSTFLGGSVIGTLPSTPITGLPFEETSGIAVDANGNSWVTGFTATLDFPTKNPVRATSPCDPTSNSFCIFGSFLSEFSGTGTLLFSTYLAPSEGFINDAIAIDPQGNVYVAGTATSTGLGQTTVLGTPTASGEHAFISKFAPTSTLADLSVTLAHNPDPVTIGQDITFTATIKNNGPNPATGVTFYPTQIANSTIQLLGTLNSATASQGSCGSSTSEVCFLGSLANGVTATVTLVVSTFTGQEGIQTVAVGVGGNEGDPATANNVATTTVNVLGGVDLGISGTVLPTPTVLGSNLTYQLQITNFSSNPASGVTLTDTPPSGFTFVSAVSPQGQCLSIGSIVCSLSDIAGGGSATVSIQVTPAAAGIFTNIAKISSTEGDTDPTNNTFTQQTDVVAVANSNNARLNGNYAFLFHGFDAGGAMGSVGSFVADGNGNLTAGNIDTNATSGVTGQAFTGTYSIGADNRGTLKFVLPGQTLTYRFSLALFNTQGVSTKGRFVEFDNSGTGGSGFFEMQDASAFTTAALNGGFAFGGFGANAAGARYAIAGRLTANGNGNITAGVLDTDAGGALSPNVAFTGSYGVSANGRGTLSLVVGPTETLVFYVVSANELLLITPAPRSTFPFAAMQALKQSASLTNASLGGTAVLNSTGLTSGAAFVSIGLINGDGQGNLSFNLDINQGGTLKLNNTVNMTAAVASSGRVTLAGGTSPPVLYLAGANQGFLVGTDAVSQDGFFEPQTAGPFTNPSITGTFAFSTAEPAVAAVSNNIGIATLDGSGNALTTEDDNKSGVLVTDAFFVDTYSVSPDGRALLGGGDILYVVSPSKVVAINASQGKSNDVITIAENQVTPGPSADMAVSVVPTATSVSVGSPVTLTFTVANNGPSPATNVGFANVLPAALTFVSDTSSLGTCSQASGTVSCTLGNMASGTTATVVVNVTANAVGTAVTTGSVNAQPADPNNANNTVTSSVDVTASGSGCSGGNQWTGATSNVWAVATNWSSGAVPVATDTVCIGTAFSGSTITIGALAAANQTIASLVANSTLTLTAGPITVTGAATFSGPLNVNGGTLTLASGGQLGVTHIASGTLISNGSLTLSGATTLSSGSLTGSGNITASALFTWTGGTLVGTATPNATFNATAGIDFNGGTLNGSSHQLNQRTLNLPAGTVSLSGQSNSIAMITGALLHIPPGTVLAFDQDNGLANNQSIVNSGGIASSIINDGIIRKLAGNTGTTLINVPLNLSSTGRLESLSGTITISGGGSSTGGTFLATAPGTLNFGASYTSDATTSFTGTGNYIFSGGTVTSSGTYNVTGDTTINSGTLAMNAAPVAINTIHLSGGSLTGSANITPTGLFTWTGGTLVGTATPNATFNATAGIDFNGGTLNGSSHQLNQRTLNLPAGTVSLSGQSNSIAMITGALLHIPPGTVLAFDQDNGLANNQSIVNSGGIASSIINDGIIRKLAGNTGTTLINVPLNLSSTGRLESLSGTITISGGGSSTGGTFLATAPGTLNFGASYTSDATTSFTGTGNYIFSGGTVTSSGTYNVTGDTTINSGTLAMNAAPVAINTIHLAGGSLTGSANITPTGLFTWTGGTLVGTATPNATFNATAGIDFNGGTLNGSSHQLNQRTLNLPAGTVSLSGQSDSIAMITGALLHIPAGTILAFDQDNGLANNQSIVNSGGTASSIINDGIIRKLAGNTGTTLINVPLNLSSTGRLESLSGTITISGGGSSTGGTFLATAPGTLNFGASYTSDATTSFTGTGNYIFSGGTVTSSGTYNVTGDTTINSGTLAMNAAPVAINTIHLSGGSLTGSANITPTGLFTWTGGTLVGTATPNATFNATAGIDFNGGTLNGSSHQLNQRTLNLPAGTVSLSGQSNSIAMITGALLHIPPGTVLAFDQDNGLIGNQGIIGAGGAASTLLNDGTIRKLTGNSGTSIINGINFNMSATGRLEALSGTVSVVSPSGLSSGGTFLAAAPGIINFNANYATDAATSFTGTGNYIFASGIVTSSGTYNVTGDTTINSGTLNFNATPVAINTVHLTNGTLGGTANITPAGLFTWTAGTLSGSATPNAVFNANAGIDFNGTNPTGSSHVLTQRTLNLPAAAATLSGQSNGVTLSSGAVFHVPVGATLTFDQDNGLIGNQGIFAGGGVPSSLLNDGTIRKLAGNPGTTALSVPTQSAGTIEVLSGTLNITGLFLQTAGTTRVNGGKISSPQVLSFSGGTLQGIDAPAPPTIISPISNSGAALHPGLSPGILSTAGALTQGANSSFNVDMNGTAPGTGYSQLNVAGAVSLGGTLNVTLGGGFTPATGNTFTILACSGTPTCLAGTFAATNFPTLPGGLAFTPSYNANSIVLTVGAAVGPDLTITKVASVATTHIGGGNFTYTLTAKNNGPTAATGVTVTDPLPANVTFVSAAPPGACTGTTTLTCVIGNLANGATSAVTVTVAPAAVGTATNTAAVTANETDSNPGNNSATATVQIQPTADLQITKTASPSPVNVGSNLTYTITVTNNGPAPATGVTVTDTPPTAVATYVSVEASQGSCTAPPTITCSLGNLANGATATVTLIMTPTTPGAILNTATVAANEFDPNTANNTSTANVTANAATDLAVSVNANPNPDGLGNPLNVVVTVTNNGPSAATGVSLSNPLPAGATLTSSTVSQGTCNAALTCTIGNLAKGASATLTLVLNPTAVGNVTDTATVSAAETDPVPTNNSASATVSITAASDLAVTQTVNSPIIFGTANVIYHVTVMNNGPSQANNITLTDVLAGSIVDESISGATCSEAPALTFTCVFSLASGASQQLTIVAPPTAAGTSSNNASVTSANFDPNPANNTSSASAVVNPSVDLSLAVNAPQTAFVGGTINLAYTIQNANTLSNATGVTLGDTLPAGLSFVSSTPPVCSGAATVTCNIGPLAKGAATNVAILVRVNAAGNFTNTANVSATEPDIFPSNNTAINSFTASASADLAIVITTAPPTPAVGVNLTYTMTVTNAGPSPATNATVVGAFTTGANFVSFTPTQGTCTGTGQFNCFLGSLASGATARVVVVVTPTVAGQLGTTDSITSDQPDPDQANNSQTVLVNVVSAPTLTLSAPSLSFASQPVGTPSPTQTITIANTSSVLPVANLSVAASGDFTQTNNCGSGLATQASCNIFVTFKPTATGTRTGAITLTDNAVGNPQSVSLTGIGVNAAAITLTPGSLVFSSRQVGTSSTPQPITVTNSGNATLTIASIAITGTNPGDFSQTNTCLPAATLAPNASCTVNVTFKPTDGGQRTAGVAITSDARGSVPVATLSGTGLAAGLEISSSLLVFDNQVVSTKSQPQTVTVTNATSSAIAVSSITASGDYAETDNCKPSVAANSSCSIQVTFTPTVAGPRSGTLSITAADSGTPHTVNLSGTGVVVTLSLSPTSLTFADQKVGTTSQSLPLTINSTGGGVLSISSIAASGDFLISGEGACTTVAVASSCSVNVSFLPTTTGTRTGTITITSNAQGSPHTAGLTGNGISKGPAVSLTCGTPAAACAGLVFPGQALTTSSAPQTVTLSNTGNDVLNITSISASGDFAASSCPATLAAGASCPISVTFTPAVIGTRSGLLTIKDNSGDSPQTLGLAGTGTPFGPAISLSATALPFGSVLVGSSVSLPPITVTNTGNANLTFASISASGDFTQSNTCVTAASGVPANSTCTITITFTPTATGARAGAITITDNAPASPQSITLSGNGTDITIVPASGSSAAASIAAGQSATFQLSLIPSGGFASAVTVTCGGAIPASTCSASPNSFSLDAPATVGITVTTVAPSKSILLPPGPQGPGWIPRDLNPLRVLLQSLLALLAFALFALATRRRRRGWIAAAAALFLIALVSGVSGCAGGSPNPGVVGQTTGTPVGTYTVTVTVKTAAGGTRTFPLTVTVH